jgi:hypothetical protein
MPEDIFEARKKRFQQVRLTRIQQLAKEWNVPTQNIFTTVHWPYDNKVDLPDRTDYFTFDENGKVKYQKIDYAPVRGYPSGVFSKRTEFIPTGDSSDLPIKPIGTLPSIKTSQQVLRKGGTIRKAEYGDILPVGRSRNISTDLENAPVAPLKAKDMSVSNFFNSPLNQRLIPNDASLNGPEPGYPQGYIDGESGDFFLDNGNGPEPIASDQRSAQGNFNMSINAGSLITGFNSAFNQLYDRSRGIKEFSRLKRKQLQDTGYNPFNYGTGSSAIYRKGGAITPVGKTTGQSNPIYQFNGPSHEQGGIPIRYGGKQVEVEGGETAYRSANGDLNIFGNLTIPGTNIKFKTAGKQLGKLEDALTKKMKKAHSIIENSDPQDKFASLAVNSAQLQQSAFQGQQDTVNSLKEKLSLLQERVLSLSGGNPSKARKGAVVEQEDPKKKLKPSMAQRHNNPGNIKYADWLGKRYGAIKGERSSDGDNFARFPDLATGLKAMRGLLKGPGYKKLSVEKALQRWSNTPGYNLDLGDLKDKTVGTLGDDELKRVMDIITQGEDSKLYDLDTLISVRRDDPHFDIAINPPALPVKPIRGPQTPGTYVNTPPDTNKPGTPSGTKDSLPGINEPPPTQKSHPNPLQFNQIAPEILALGDRPDFVPGQRYEPNLYQPYQVSFQDRLNENQATFNRVAMQTGNNPSALSLLAGQKYQADSAILSDEFRTNQGITNDITNKNISLLNDAQLKNLQLADTQFVRQAQAVANTRQNIYNAINSVASKIGQNRLETRTYNAASSLFPQYDFDESGNMVYLRNDNMSFGAEGTGDDDSYYQRQREEYDGSGKLKKKMVTTPSEAEQLRIDTQNWNNLLKKRMSMMQMGRKLKLTS